MLQSLRFSRFLSKAKRHASRAVTLFALFFEESLKASLLSRGFIFPSAMGNFFVPDGVRTKKSPAAEGSFLAWRQRETKGEAMNNQSIYEKVTQKIIAKLNNGVVPWKASWKGVGFPVNAVSKKEYRGINSLLLACEGYNSPFWMTFKQAKDLGGNVNTGEKATPVIFWKWIDVEDKETGGKDKIPLLRHYNVFNLLQCTGIKLESGKDKVEGIEACENVVCDFLGRDSDLTLEHKKSYPFYLPLKDIVNVPSLNSFNKPEDYYLSLFHELIHATGHEKRLDRGLTKPTGFASKEYSKEELVAELGASFLSGVTGIESKTLDDSAGYISGWIKALKDDSKLLIHAGAQAQHAVDFILGTESKAAS